MYKRKKKRKVPKALKRSYIAGLRAGYNKYRGKVKVAYGKKRYSRKVGGGASKSKNNIKSWTKTRANKIKTYRPKWKNFGRMYDGEFDFTTPKTISLYSGDRDREINVKRAKGGFSVKGYVFSRRKDIASYIKTNGFDSFR